MSDEKIIQFPSKTETSHQTQGVPVIKKGDLTNRFSKAGQLGKLANMLVAAIAIILTIQSRDQDLIKGLI
jgi:hypothetical protein